MFQGNLYSNQLAQLPKELEYKMNNVEVIKNQDNKAAQRLRIYMSEELISYHKQDAQFLVHQKY